MTKETFAKAVGELRRLGCAVVIFSPEELVGCEPRDLEESLIAYAWGAIDALKKAEANNG